MPAFAALSITLATVIVSLIAFRNHRLVERLIFRPERILAQKEWHRMFSVTLLHADFPHLLFNMIGLYLFGESIELWYGPGVFMGVYLLSTLGASALSLFLHRNHADYSAVGASGGVSGVIFACIFLVPGTGVGMYFLPIVIPGPIYALGYLALTFYAMRKGMDNVGHDAHFGGAVMGLVFALILAPQNCLEAGWLFGVCAVISVVGLWIVAKDPMGLSGKFLSTTIDEYSERVSSERYDYLRERKQRETEVDRILEKLNGVGGLHKLTEREREILERESMRLRR